ncbi:ATPase family protein associated with various cellular activities (AAA) [Nocardia tenerifensis]|uniref:ATPase family protein associated with various cellular activities (AAA) n=1 Tax=Nocardia tenerifensis TaxID=228006 RepID=A0A318K8S7_9NOCA|nr:ATP-binding protein [Nocardia tenerifensis]PXX60823.1 ATPase family protein associated with various cellular activities (AAA) [Nocardia tenerifensis]
MNESGLDPNDRYLVLSLMWLRLLLRRVAQRRGPVTPVPVAEMPETLAPVSRSRGWWRGHTEPAPAVTPAQPVTRPSSLDAEIAEAAQHIADAAEQSVPELEMLRRVFGLTEFERNVLLLCAAPELDTGIGTLLEAAYGSARPSFAIAMDLFDDAAWDARSPQRPLRYWQLADAGAEPMSTGAPLRVDERILHAIKGLHHLDARLAICLEPMAAGDTLPPSQQEVADSAVRLIQRAANTGELPVVQLVGTHAPDRAGVAAAIATALRLELYRVRISSLAAVPVTEIDSLARLWHRETLLAPRALLFEDDGGDEHAAPRQSWAMFVRRSGGLVLTSAPDLSPDMSAPTVSLEVARPTGSEQHGLWSRALGSEQRARVGVLAEQFRLDGPEIARIVGYTDLPADPDAATRALQTAARQSLRPRLAKLATRVRPVATWDTLVLPDHELDQLHQIAEQVAHRSTVYSQWGFGARMNRGLGINALFAGETGTGKTMAAEVLANALGLDLYRIDLAGVVDKYVGETPKHVRTIFDWGEAGEAILFFDECDAIFGKRSEVKDAHDRYANIEIDYLLQRMESYRGLAILATNMRDAVDRAFLRRLRFVVNFPFPSAEDRERMWRLAFPADTPVGALDYARLARVSLTGAAITDAALGAAFRAAAHGGEVGMRDVLMATRDQLRKQNRPVNEADFRVEQGVSA